MAHARLVLHHDSIETRHFVFAYPFHPHLFNLYLLPPVPTLHRGQSLDDGTMDVVLSRLSTQLLSPLSSDELLFREHPAFLSRYVTYALCILLSMLQRRALLV